MKPDDLADTSEEKLKNANEYLFKISLFYSTKIPVQEQDKASDFIYKLYQNYAHQIPILYVFRTWIIQNSTVSRNNINSNTTKTILAEIKKTNLSFTKLINGY